MRKKSELVDIECRVVSADRPSAIAVVNGTMEDDPYKAGKKRLQWFWLPRAMVEVNDDGTVTMPRQLAEEKGLV